MRSRKTRKAEGPRILKGPWTQKEEDVAVVARLVAGARNVTALLVWDGRSYVPVELKRRKPG